MEVTDIFDKDCRRTGRTLLRGERPGEGEYLQAAAAVVCVGGRILVTKRHPRKSFGGMWEFPGGGSRTREEPLDTLYRELEEETGIQAGEDEVTFLDTVFFAPYHLFLQVYLVEANASLEDLKLQETEITQAMFVTPGELSILSSALADMDRQVYEEVVKGLLEADGKEHKPGL